MKFMQKFLPLMILASTLLCAQAGTLVQFRMPVGTIDVELYDADKPVTVQNFISYVKSGIYKNMIVHRWAPGFVFQGGGFYVIDRFTTNALIDAVSIFGTITNEYNVGRLFSNGYGTIAMARVGGQTNSASSQWFFNLANNASLDAADGGFTVFGRVIRGTNVLERFNSTATTNNLYTINLGGALSALPVISTNTAIQPTIEDLVFVDITLLQVSVEKLQGARRISWNSVSNKLNLIEFTTKFPPSWQTLVSTNGNGARFTYTDSSTNSPARFYRVRADY